MERADKQARAFFEDISHGGERSPLFWWLAEHHEEVAQAIAGQRVRWQQFASWMAQLGLTQVGGKPPTASGCRLTWYRVRLYVAACRRTEPAPAVQDQDDRFAMPRSPDARPLLVEGPAPAHTELVANRDNSTEQELVCQPVASARNAVLDASIASTTAQPSSLSLFPVAAPAAPPARNRPPPTPEQIAHRDEQIAKARARHGITDRFINLKE